MIRYNKPLLHPTALERPNINNKNDTLEQVGEDMMCIAEFTPPGEASTRGGVEEVSDDELDGEDDESRKNKEYLTTEQILERFMGLPREQFEQQLMKRMDQQMGVNNDNNNGKEESSEENEWDDPDLTQLKFPGEYQQKEVIPLHDPGPNDVDL